jgi:ribosomal RNA-processing protein 12
MEAIMGVKEHSEKSRKAAFNLLVVMGGRMGQGGSIRMDLLNESGDSDAEGMERDASIEEFVKMVGASLAADKAHTISAGVMSLSRVLFEFKGTTISRSHRLLLTLLLLDDVSETYQADIVATVYPLLGVTNREIVKSVLGFVKLSIHSLSPKIVQPQLNTLVPALLACLAAHGHHFKVKIRHIFERLLRKYGADEIERHALNGNHDNDGGLKMILNIKKRKERAARKRRAGAIQGNDSEDVSLSMNQSSCTFSYSNQRTHHKGL